MIFYEAPHKLRKTLSDFSKVFGPQRRVALCRELTKVHEEVWRTTLGEAAAHYRDKEPRGEFVLVVEGAAPAPEPQESLSLEEAVALAQELAGQGLSPSEAAKEAARQSGLRRGEVYAALVRAQEKGGGLLENRNIFVKTRDAHGKLCYTIPN